MSNEKIITSIVYEHRHPKETKHFIAHLGAFLINVTRGIGNKSKF